MFLNYSASAEGSQYGGAIQQVQVVRQIQQVREAQRIQDYQATSGYTTMSVVAIPSTSNGYAATALPMSTRVMLQPALQSPGPIFENAPQSTPDSKRGSKRNHIGEKRKNERSASEEEDDEPMPKRSCKDIEKRLKILCGANIQIQEALKEKLDDAKEFNRVRSKYLDLKRKVSGFKIAVEEKIDDYKARAEKAEKERGEKDQENRTLKAEVDKARLESEKASRSVVNLEQELVKVQTELGGVQMDFARANKEWAEREGSMLLKWNEESEVLKREKEELERRLEAYENYRGVADRSQRVDETRKEVDNLHKEHGLDETSVESGSSESESEAEGED